ncbi:MAG TPA: hypothetical protein ENN60_00965 [archaeon]|nr:hypothetical protein [archaeon]
MKGCDWSLFGLPRGNVTKPGKTAVFGICYDSTSELGKGTAAFPIAVRLASSGVEWEQQDAPVKPAKFTSVHDLGAVDVGDLIPSPHPDMAFSEIADFLDSLWSEGFRRFLVLGGNHSVTIPVVKFLHEKKAIHKYVQFDAHADAREIHTGIPNSFACTFRRVAETIGPENCSLIGIRSVAEEEADFVNTVKVIYGSDMNLSEAEKLVNSADYISVDIDVLEHASVTNPEPHNGMTLGQVLKTLSGSKTGFDIVEGIPQKYFGDPTATAAALIARKALTLLGGDNHGKN